MRGRLALLQPSFIWFGPVRGATRTSYLPDWRNLRLPGFCSVLCSLWFKPEPGLFPLGAGLFLPPLTVNTLLHNGFECKFICKIFLTNKVGGNMEKGQNRGFSGKTGFLCLCPKIKIVRFTQGGFVGLPAYNMPAAYETATGSNVRALRGVVGVGPLNHLFIEPDAAQNHKGHH